MKFLKAVEWTNTHAVIGISRAHDHCAGVVYQCDCGCPIDVQSWLKRKIINIWPFSLALFKCPTCQKWFGILSLLFTYPLFRRKPEPEDPTPDFYKQFETAGTEDMPQDWSDHELQYDPPKAEVPEIIKPACFNLYHHDEPIGRKVLRVYIDGLVYQRMEHYCERCEVAWRAGYIYAYTDDSYVIMRPDEFGHRWLEKQEPKYLARREILFRKFDGGKSRIKTLEQAIEDLDFDVVML